MVKVQKKRSKESKTKHETGKTISTPSWFGSHKSMVVEDLGNGKVVLEDDQGRYETYTNRLDNGLADPLRYSGRSEIAPV